jgi:methyl-accepting chemotaxis protein
VTYRLRRSGSPDDHRVDSTRRNLDVVRQRSEGAGSKMRRFRDWPVAVKLGGGFGAVLALLLVIALVGLSKLSASNARTAMVATNTVPSVQLIGDQYTRTSDYRTLQLEHVIATSNATMDRLQGRLAAIDAQITAAFARYRSMFSDARDRALYDQAVSQWNAYKAQTKPFLAYSRALQTAKASGVLNAGQRTFDRLSATLIAWAKYNKQLSDRSLAQSQSAYHSSRTLILVLLLAAIVLGAAVAVLITRQIKGVVSVVLDRLHLLRDHCSADLAAALGAMAQGDLTVSVTPVTPPIDDPAADELGQVAAAVNGIRDSTVASVQAYNDMRNSLSGVVGELTESAGTVSSASQQMASTSEETGRAVGEIASAVTEVAQGAERQVRMVESTRTAVREAARAANSSAETAEATSAAAEARRVAQDGVAAAGEASEAIRLLAASSAEVGTAIESLSARSHQIGGIVDTITGIAEQTNLLALNAAIEAARAGEQGRGFAVVAEEVRKLAEESQSAAGEIAGLIAEIQAETGRVVGVVADGAQRTEDGVATVQRTGEAFTAIGDAVQEMSDQVAEIAAAVAQIGAETQRAEADVSEIASVAEQSSASAEQVSASTQQTSASAQEIAASAQSLAGTAEQLNEIVRRFKVTA